MEDFQRSIRSSVDEKQKILQSFFELLELDARLRAAADREQSEGREHVPVQMFSDDARARIKELSANEVPILLLGPANSGKSTFLNLWIGEELLLASDGYTTARSVRIRSAKGGQDQFQLVHQDGSRDEPVVREAHPTTTPPSHTAKHDNDNAAAAAATDDDDDDEDDYDDDGDDSDGNDDGATPTAASEQLDRGGLWGSRLREAQERPPKFCETVEVDGEVLAGTDFYREEFLRFLSTCIDVRVNCPLLDCGLELRDLPGVTEDRRNELQDGLVDLFRRQNGASPLILFLYKEGTFQANEKLALARMKEFFPRSPVFFVSNFLDAKERYPPQANMFKATCKEVFKELKKIQKDRYRILRGQLPNLPPDMDSCNNFACLSALQVLTVRQYGQAERPVHLEVAHRIFQGFLVKLMEWIKVEVRNQTQELSTIAQVAVKNFFEISSKWPEVSPEYLDRQKKEAEEFINNLRPTLVSALSEEMGTLSRDLIQHKRRLIEVCARLPPTCIPNNQSERALVRAFQEVILNELLSDVEVRAVLNAACTRIADRFGTIIRNIQAQYQEWIQYAGTNVFFEHAFHLGFGVPLVASQISGPLDFSLAHYVKTLSAFIFAMPCGFVGGFLGALGAAAAFDALETAGVVVTAAVGGGLMAFAFFAAAFPVGALVFKKLTNVHVDAAWMRRSAEMVVTHLVGTEAKSPFVQGLQHAWKEDLIEQRIKTCLDAVRQHHALARSTREIRQRISGSTKDLFLPVCRLSAVFESYSTTAVLRDRPIVVAETVKETSRAKVCFGTWGDVAIAVKYINLATAGDSVWTESFFQRHLSAQAVPLMGQYTTADSLVLITPRYEHTLRDVMPTLQPKEARRIALDICQFLIHAEELSINHGDLKPSNILIRNGRAFVGDFGLTHWNYCPPPAAGGAEAYLDPRYFQDPAMPLARSDQYSYAVILCELFAPSGYETPVRLFQRDPAGRKQFLQTGRFQPPPGPDELQTLISALWTVTPYHRITFKEAHARLLRVVFVRECTICLSNIRNIRLLPCKHVATCAECAPLLRVCCLCRRAVTGYEHAHPEAPTYPEDNDSDSLNNDENIASAASGGQASPHGRQASDPASSDEQASRQASDPASAPASSGDQDSQRGGQASDPAGSGERASGQAEDDLVSSGGVEEASGRERDWLALSDTWAYD